MVIDFYIRPPLKSFINSDLYMNGNLPRGLFSRMAEGREPLPARKQGLEGFIDEFDASGVDLGIIIGCATRSENRKEYANSAEALAEFINNYPNRFRGISAIDVSAPDAMQQVRRARYMGMVGVCVEPFRGTGGLPINASQFFDIYKAIEEEELLLVIPLNFLSGNSTACNQPQSIEDISILCNKLRIIIPYACYPKLNEFMAMIARYPGRIYSLPTFYFYYPFINTARDQTVMYNHMLQDQVLYGSAYPMRNLTQALRESLERAWLPEPREKFLHKNAEKLLNWTLSSS